MAMSYRPFIGQHFRLFLGVSLLLMQCTLLTSCMKNDETLAGTSVDIKQFADGFVSPIGVVAATPDNTGHLFVIDQAGKYGYLTLPETNCRILLWMLPHVLSP